MRAVRVGNVSDDNSIGFKPFEAADRGQQDTFISSPFVSARTYRDAS